MKKTELELLKKLYTISSPTGREKSIKRFIRKWINDNVENAVEIADSYGNMYITKGTSETYPCVVAHLDEVHNHKGRKFKVIDDGEVLLGFNIAEKDFVGIGADDKNGIWVCLQCLKKYDNIKVAFFVEEESGTVGSSHADVSWFSDCRFILECDRKTGCDLIASGCYVGIASDDFLNDIGYEAYGYKTTEGGLTDVVTLTESEVGVSCLNIACGYYNPHTQYEFTVISELDNCLDFVQHIIETCTNVYPNEYVPCGYGNGYGYGYGNGYNYLRSKYYGESYEEEEVDEQFHKMEDLMMTVALDKDIDFDLDDFYLEHWGEFTALYKQDYIDAYFEVFGERYIAPTTKTSNKWEKVI